MKEYISAPRMGCWGVVRAESMGVEGERERERGRQFVGKINVTGVRDGAVAHSSTALKVHSQAGSSPLVSEL